MRELAPVLCPHCGGIDPHAKVKSVSMGCHPGPQMVRIFACGTCEVDGELRIGKNCAQHVENHAEAQRLKAEIAALRGHSGGDG